MVRISASPKIRVFLDLIEKLRHVKDPADAIYRYSEAMRQVYGDSAFVYLCTRGLPPGQFRITRLRYADGTEHVPAQHAHRYHELPIYEGGFLGTIIGAGESHVTDPVDLSADPHLGTILPGIHSAIVASIPPTPFPMDFAVLFDRDSEQYTMDGLDEFVLRVSALTALVNQIYTAVELQTAHDFIDNQVREIARIQRSLLPHDLPPISGLELAVLYQTFELAGGDMYDLIRLHTPHDQEEVIERWAIFVADASGHGPAAAVVMAMVHAILHAARRDVAGPADALRHLNRQLCAMRINASFVTAFLAFYEPANSRIIYSRAGHNPPMYQSVTGTQSLLNAVGEIPLGIDPEIIYTQTNLDLQPGDTVVIYTDGIVEALAPDGAMFGLEGISQTLGETTQGAPDVIKQIKHAVEVFQGNGHPNDDQTIVVLHAL
ncbi:MAG: serine/threonine-protein phosphatase [Planctomycetota bacterium]|nr:serine/threonine-protein phosphatase [Planctomycetota bacterium]